MNDDKPAPTWGGERDRFLREHYLDGKSAREIAGLVNKKFGLSVSRNAVIGRVARLGISRQKARKGGTPTSWAPEVGTKTTPRSLTMRAPKEITPPKPREPRQTARQTQATIPNVTFKAEPVRPSEPPDEPVEGGATIFELGAFSCRNVLNRNPPAPNEPWKWCGKRTPNRWKITPYCEACSQALFGPPKARA